jgi:hypothetical protein
MGEVTGRGEVTVSFLVPDDSGDEIVGNEPVVSGVRLECKDHYYKDLFQYLDLEGLVVAAVKDSWV